jgi:replicative DNA helicase
MEVLKRYTEETSHSPLRVNHVSKAVSSARQFINDRREGRIKSLKTPFNKLNSCLLDGIDWWRIMTIAGLPGSGKSTIASQIKKGFLDLNVEEDFEILSFEFEMRMEDQLARDIASKTDRSVKEIYSAQSPLSDDAFDEVNSVLTSYANKPLYYVEEFGSATDVVQTIMSFCRDRGLTKDGKGLVVTIDHVLLTKGKQGEGEKQKIDALSHALVGLKQYFSSIGQKIIIIMLSQLNRDIGERDRVSNKKLHYPTMNDLFAASSVYQCSDYVLVSHIPGRIPGISVHYGPPREGFPYGFPVRCPDDPSREMVYWHLIKERFGDPKILTLVQDFQHSRLIEYDLVPEN